MRGLTFFLAFAALLAAAPPSPAQTPPSDRDLRVYAGLHAAAALGDVAEIEKLIKEGESPNLQDSNSRTGRAHRTPRSTATSCGGRAPLSRAK